MTTLSEVIDRLCQELAAEGNHLVSATNGAIHLIRHDGTVNKSIVVTQPEDLPKPPDPEAEVEHETASDPTTETVSGEADPPAPAGESPAP